MKDVIAIQMSRKVVTELLMNREPNTLRMTELGSPDKDGFYLPTFVVESMDPELPDPWVFDGYRRIYDDGKVLPIWQARAIDLTDIEIEAGSGRAKASFQVGQGSSMVEARDALLGVLRG